MRRSRRSWGSRRGRSRSTSPASSPSSTCRPAMTATDAYWRCSPTCVWHVSTLAESAARRSRTSPDTLPPMAEDLLSRIGAEIDARMRELRPFVDEYEQTLAAADALERHPAL